VEKEVSNQVVAVPVLLITMPGGIFVQVFNNGTMETNVERTDGIDMISGAVYDVKITEKPSIIGGVSSGNA
jgi:hypothetical protein